MINHTNWQGTAEMIRRTATVRGREAAGLYSIEGTRLITRAIHAGAALETILMSESFHADPRGRSGPLLVELGKSAVAVYVAPDAVLRELTEGRDLGAILGLVALPPAATLTELTGGGPAQRSLFLAGVDIIDPGNAGALVRTAHAAGATAFLAVGSTDPFHPRATRISRGSVLRLPVIHYASADELLGDLRSHAVRTVATAATGGTALPHLAVTPGATAVLMGNEGEGLPENIQQAVDYVVTIPMPEGVDSFAVNAAAAIVLYELQRNTWRDQ